MGLHTVNVPRLRIWELGKLRRVLCLRKRPNECWTDHMKLTSVIVARQLKKHNPRVQTLAMRRVHVAAWQMVPERCERPLRRNVEIRTHKTVQERPSEQQALETLSPKQTDLLGATFHAILVKTTPQVTRFRDAKECNIWLQIRI